MKFVRKLFEKLRDYASWVLIGALVIFGVLLAVGDIFEAVIAVITIAGHGSLIQGIIMGPFFVFGCFQIIRGFINALDRPTPYYHSKKTAKRYDLSSLYFLAMILGYYAVYDAICAWAQARVP